MLRYFITAWNVNSPEQSAASMSIRERQLSLPRQWTTALDVPGLTVYVFCPTERGDRVIPLIPDVGVFLGTLFDSASTAEISRTVTQAGHQQAQKIVGSLGRSAIQDYWGSYILALRNPNTGRAYILRSPMSRLPCFYTSYRGTTLLFSSVNDLDALSLFPLTINWNSIVAQVSRCDWVTSETALAEVSTLEAGDCLEFNDGRCVRHGYWDPRSIAKEPPIEDFVDATSLLRSAVQQGVNAWASLHESILIKLSGGLDSSIVVSCLVRAPTRPRICAVNYYTEGAGDERAYARGMAELQPPFELVERERNHHVDLRMFTSCARTERPIINFSACDVEPSDAALARPRYATAVFDGELGDNIFGNGLWTEVLAEYVWRHGWTPSLMSIVIDYALLRKQSIWSTLRATFRTRSATRRKKFWSAYDRMRTKAPSASEGFLISAEALRGYEESRERFVHPWLKDIGEVPPGKFSLVFGLILTNSIGAHSPFSKAGDPVPVSPLTSQPIVEACLKIASYLHMKDGQNRAVARAAFGDWLSPLVLHRGRGKGTPSLWIQEVIARNRAFLREYLLDGALVRQGILDRAKIERVLAPNVDSSNGPISDILVQLYVETWVRQWSHPSLKRVT